MRIAIAVLLTVMIVPLAIGDDSDALDDGAAFYCYGDSPRLDYEYAMQDGMRIGWSVKTLAGTDVPFTAHENGKYIIVDLSGVDYGAEVRVIQSVYSGEVLEDTATIDLIPLHIGGETHEVTFMDGSSVFSRTTIDHKTVVMKGQDHVVLPAPPVKDGYEFGGWYTDTTFSEVFDPEAPVEGDITVHAKWIGSGSGGHTSSIVIRTHVVTFQTVTGLEYRIVDQDSDSVSFEVGVVGGYELTDGTLSVVSDNGTLSLDGGTYTLSSIDGDTLISISGEVHHTDPNGPLTPSEEDGDGFPWWIVIIAIVLIIAVLAIKMLRDKRTKNR